MVKLKTRPDRDRTVTAGYRVSRHQLHWIFPNSVFLTPINTDHGPTIFLASLLLKKPSFPIAGNRRPHWLFKMSVFIDCRKRGASVFLDDALCDSLSLSKRIRLSDAAAILATPSPPPQNPLDLLRARFPELDIEVIYFLLLLFSSFSRN